MTCREMPQWSGERKGDWSKSDIHTGQFYTQIIQGRLDELTSGYFFNKLYLCFTVLPSLDLLKWKKVTYTQCCWDPTSAFCKVRVKIFGSFHSKFHDDFRWNESESKLVIKIGVCLCHQIKVTGAQRGKKGNKDFSVWWERTGLMSLE